MKMNVKIESGIPIPESKDTVIPTLKKMKNGDSIVIPLGKANSWRSIAARNKIGYVTRKISDTEIRFWRVK